MSASDSPLFSYHKALLKTLCELCQEQMPFCLEEASDTDRLFISKLERLQNADNRDDDFTALGQEVLSKIVGSYPHITPIVHRDLFWFFGGDCMHYLSDEEIDQYQRVDELIYEQQQQGQAINYPEARAAIFNLH